MSYIVNRETDNESMQYYCGQLKPKKIWGNKIEARIFQTKKAIYDEFVNKANFKQLKFAIEKTND